MHFSGLITLTRMALVIQNLISYGFQGNSMQGHIYDKLINRANGMLTMYMYICSRVEGTTYRYDDYMYVLLPFC